LPAASSRAASPSSGTSSASTRSAVSSASGPARRPRRDDRLGVERLLAVAVRQRDVHRGQADGRHLGDGHRPRPAQHGVGGGVGQVHVLDVGQGR
jgi:hypothetical protein